MSLFRKKMCIIAEIMLFYLHYNRFWLLVYLIFKVWAGEWCEHFPALFHVFLS